MKSNAKEGVPINLDFILNSIATIFPCTVKFKESDTLQSAFMLMANAATGQQRTTFRDSVDHDKQLQLKWRKEKSQSQEKNAIRHLTNEFNKVVKAVKDLKSDVGMIEKSMAQQATQSRTQNFNNRNRAPFSGCGDHSTQGGYHQLVSSLGAAMVCQGSLRWTSTMIPASWNSKLLSNTILPS
jgi:hypothetical protein